MRWGLSSSILCIVLVINVVSCTNYKRWRLEHKNTYNNNIRQLNTALWNHTSPSKKTLIDITGSEFPETNYQTPEFFFDTVHDFGEYDNEEILKQSEVKLEKEGDNTVGGNGRSDLIDSNQDEMSSFKALTKQENFDNDDLEAINQANEQAMENTIHNEGGETYKYDDEDAVSSFYPTTPGDLILNWSE